MYNVEVCTLCCTQLLLPNINIVPDTTDNCTNGAVRLVKGETEYEGLVEICADSSWGYICPHSWRETEAMITCRQLGYTAIG